MKRVLLVGGLTEKVIRVLRSKKKWAAAAVGVAVIATFATVALASTGSGFTPTNLVFAANLDNAVQLNSDRVKFQTKDPTYVRVQKIVIAPNGKSGWHHHPGIVIVAVELGAVTFTNSDCSSKTYGPGLANGAVFVEGGDDPGQASSVLGATVYATFVAPNNGPVTDTSQTFRIEDAVVSCP